MSNITRSHRQKVAQFSKFLNDQQDYSGAPILLRILWRMGFEIPPPYFLSAPFGWILSCLSTALCTGFGLTLATIFFGLFPWQVIIVFAVFSGLINGSIRAVSWRRKAQEMHLPKWDDFSLDHPEVNSLRR